MVELFLEEGAYQENEINEMLELAHSEIVVAALKGYIRRVRASSRSLWFFVCGD